MPAEQPHEKFAIDADGELIVCTDGLVSGKKDLVRAIKDAATLGSPSRSPRRSARKCRQV